MLTLTVTVRIMERPTSLMFMATIPILIRISWVVLAVLTTSTPVVAVLAFPLALLIAMRLVSVAMDTV